MIRYIELDDRAYQPRRRRRRRDRKNEQPRADERKKHTQSLLDRFVALIRSNIAKKRAGAALPVASSTCSAKVTNAPSAESVQTPDGGATIDCGPEHIEWAAADPAPPPAPKPKRLWHGIDGLAVTIFGIAAPCAMFALSALALPKRITLMLLDHPVETAAELILLMLVPIANYFVWTAITKNRLKFSRSAATALGASFATCLIVAAISVAAMFAPSQQFADAVGTDFAMGFAWITGLSVLAAVACAYVALRVRNTWDLVSTRRQIVACTGAGVLLAGAVFVGAEAKSWFVRSAERMAVSASPQEAKQGMDLLRKINPERELRMECSDSRAAGLAGLFIPIKASAQHELYFRLTGKPYSFREFANSDLSSMPDEYLSANVVGEPVKGLTLARSTMVGTVHPNTLTARVDWTFVFKNDTQSVQDIRAELGLPPGAAVIGYSVWTKGEEADSTFLRTASTGGASQGANYSNGEPGKVDDLGHGRVLLTANNIPQEEETKVRLSVVMPLNPDATRSASLTLPKFLATNFDLQGEQAIKLHSPLPLFGGVKGLVSNVTRDHEFTLSGEVSGEDLQSSRLVVECSRPQEIKPVFMFDKIATKQARDNQIRKEHEESERRRAEIRAARAEAREDREDSDSPDGTRQVVVWIDGSKGLTAEQLEALHRTQKKRDTKHVKHVVKMLENRYVVEYTKQLAAAAPTVLQIVVDGSTTVGPYAKQLAEALHSLPKNISAELVIASSEKQSLTERRELSRALQDLPNAHFVGGQDNLKAIVKAAERAGDTKGGAVLWVHGPQPTLSHAIYIMSPFQSAPKFYELALGAGETTDTVEYFRNHAEIGPFTQIARTSDNLAQDVRGFFRKWEPNNTAYTTQLALAKVKPADAVEATPAEAQEISLLRASEAARFLHKKRHTEEAGSLAVRYGFVSPLCEAVVNANSAAQAPDDSTEQVTDSTKKNSTLIASASVTEEGFNAPHLQGATNGTIGPQGADATVISGVNTAGTVRVNNLANLEALLNIVANLCEIGFALTGALLVLHGIARGEAVYEIMGQEFEFGPKRRIAVGIAMIVAGLCVPGLVNFFVASARDANLFS